MCWPPPGSPGSPAPGSPPCAASSPTPAPRWSTCSSKVVREAGRPTDSLTGMEFRRINALPPYVFPIMDGLKAAGGRAGDDVIDLGFGNPDIPSPEIAVEKLAEAAHNTRNHRYSASRGTQKRGGAASDLYRRRFNIEVDPEREVINTIGAKEGFSHLMWVLLQP